MFKLDRHPKNPIVTPWTSTEKTGGPVQWRSGVTFNPAVVHGPDGEIIMLERAAKLRPYQSVVGALKSDNGVDFELIQDKPVWTPADVGTPLGDTEDPRVTLIDGMYYMTFVHYKSHWNLYPIGACNAALYEHLPSDWPMDVAFQARTGLCKSTNCIDWEFMTWLGPEGWDDKDVVLFPEKINGEYVMFTRPCKQIGPEYGCDRPAMWIRTSKDLMNWSDATLHSQWDPECSWQEQKIGASAPPLKTDKGWLASFHGVNHQHQYRVGFMLLDLDDPFKVIARTKDPVLEPEYGYEKIGFIIPNCVFPSGNVIIDNKLHLYYGACDSVICLATADMDELLNHLIENCAV